MVFSHIDTFLLIALNDEILLGGLNLDWVAAHSRVVLNWYIKWLFADSKPQSTN